MPKDIYVENLPVKAEVKDHHSLRRDSLVWRMA